MRRRKAFGAVGLALIAALVASAIIASASPDPRSAVAAQLASLTTSDKHDVESLSKAARYLDDATAASVDEVFKADEKTVKELEKVKSVNVSGVIGDLAALDRAVAQAVINQTQAAGVDVSKALDKLAKADEDLAAGKADKAIKGFGDAYTEALKAQNDAAKAPAKTNKATGPSGGSSNYAIYDVVFVRADTVGSDHPVFLAVSGTNAPGTPGVTGSSNEGLIFSDQFGPGDTAFGTAGVMQLHVSCSDAFAGGVGQKSDPTATSQWLVNSIHIQKISGSVVSKECGLIGAGLPDNTTTTTVPENYDYPAES